MVSISKKTILVVDDAVENLMVLDEILKHEYDVISAQSGKEALEILMFKTPDIILLDIVMPKMDGYEVCKNIKHNDNTKSIPVVFLSANSDEADQLQGFQLGAVDYIVKPVNQSILKAKLKALLNVEKQKQRLEKQIENKIDELEKARIDIVDKLELATEYKDAETGEHINRMSKYSYAISKAYGFSEKDSELLLLASKMHDIGKIGIPDSILLKPGKLTEEEWKVMTTHTEIGAKIIDKNKSELLDIAHIVAYQHHEKWNGEGYPCGLKGEEIDINARIASVADVFDALTSDRPYRKAWDVDSAINYINEQSGEQFDPEVIKAFRKAIPEILEIRDSCNRQERMHDIIDCLMNEI